MYYDARNHKHLAASVGYFIEYIMMHGTINIKNKKKTVNKESPK